MRSIGVGDTASLAGTAGMAKATKMADATGSVGRRVSGFRGVSWWQ